MGIRKNTVKIKTALISLSDKSNLMSLLTLLKKYNIKIISSGGTYKKIKAMGFRCLEVSKFTNSKELLDGRVKTLHPKIHAGILNIRRNQKHQKEMKINNYENIDLVVTNFYPFEKVLLSKFGHKNIIENIDIGGPTIVRSAAKNYNDVVVLSNSKQYEDLANELNKNRGSTNLDFREKLAEEAFMETAYYESKIFNYFNQKSENFFPIKNIFSGKLIEKTRYGENPHQKAAIYSQNNKQEIFQISGKQLSYNNYNDLYSAISVSKTLPKNNGVAIIKHANPCGVSINPNKIKSFKEALESDPISAYGGIVSCNFKLNISLAKEINKIFFEVIVANGFDKKSVKLLKKKKKLRLIDSSKVEKNFKFNFINKFNSILVQDPDTHYFSRKDFKIVSKLKPTNKTLDKLIFAFNICRSVKSNAIVITKDYKTIGIGSGQPSRLDSCKIAIDKMKKFQKINDSDEILAASDAFFPFVDGIEKLVQAGISAVIQPSGSINDKEIIKFANQTNTILVFSKTRHFNH
ncbi:bifunctional purine biosynthesis protein [Pelagibacteraceae bacterium GOM-A5]|nr:bifunctional purine biosynthesis protein [Pelagibacteraceae bacterium GOM-A5]